MTRETMKIALCVTNFKNDLHEAISKNTFDLYAEISANYHTVLLIPSEIDDLPHIPPGLCVECYGERREYKSKIRVLWNIIALGKYLRRNNNINNYDIIHFHVANLIEMFLIWLFVPRIGAFRVVTVWQPYLNNSELVLVPKLFRDQLSGIIFHCLTNSFFHIPLFWIGQKYFDKIIVSSNYQKSQINFFPKCKVIVIPNGVQCPDRVKLKFSDDQNKLLYIGHATAVKGIDILFKALKSIQGDIDIKITMAFSDFSNLDIQKMMDSHGLSNKITLKGNVDVYEEMINHDLFVLPLKVSVGTSHNPNILLECLATGLPIIVSSLEFIQDIVTDGKTGILIPENDPDALGKAIVDSFSNKYSLSVMSKFQKEEFKKKYTLKKFVERHINLYERISSVHE